MNFAKSLSVIFYLLGNFALISFCFIGIALIIGASKHWPILFNITDNSFFPLLKLLQKSWGDKGLKLFYIIDGSLFIIFSIWQLISFNTGGFHCRTKGNRLLKLTPSSPSRFCCKK